MVLEAGLICRILLISTIFIGSGCAANDSKVTDHASVRGYDLMLKTSQGSCVLESKMDDGITLTTFKIDPPCYFLRRENGELQSFSYEDVRVLSAVMVIGSLVSEKRERNGQLKKMLYAERRGKVF